jgi:hypothetical protein
MEQFKTGLAENGLVEGRNITVDYFWGEGKRERLQQLAAELAQRDLDVIVTAGPQRRIYSKPCTSGRQHHGPVDGRYRLREQAP